MIEGKFKRPLWNRKEAKPSNNEKEKIYDDLVKLANTIDKKDEHKHSDRHVIYYFGIRELEKLFDDIDNDSYNYTPVLTRSSFEENYKRYESREDKNKKYQSSNIFIWL